MLPEPTPIEIDEYGHETHPSWGVVRLTRRSYGPPGAELFESDIRHHETVHLEIVGATRKRDLHSDWVHGQSRAHIEIVMTLSQWGHLVSSFGVGKGTPVTIERLGGKAIPGVADEVPRLALTAREVQEAAKKSTEGLQEALNAVLTAFDAKAGRVEMRTVLDKLKAHTQNLPSNMKFAADSLTRHTEAVVNKARTDIEATYQRAELASNAEQLAGFRQLVKDGMIMLPPGNDETDELGTYDPGELIADGMATGYTLYPDGGVKFVSEPDLRLHEALSAYPNLPPGDYVIEADGTLTVKPQP